MADRPIIMSPKMVGAIFAEICSPGTGKIETRRLLYSPRKIGIAQSFLQDYKPPGAFFLPVGQGWGLPGWHLRQPGDRLWVREGLTRSGGLIQYSADTKTTHHIWPTEWKRDTKRSIYMPRELSRITLHVREVRIERLQAITEDAARREGAQLAAEGAIGYGVPAPRSYRHGFVRLWNSLHAYPCGWADDPWVVVIRFHPVLGNIDKLSTSVDSAPAA